MKNFPASTCALIIGGTDPSGGAGLPADTRAMHAFHVHACSVVTSIVAQNTRGVKKSQIVSPDILSAQLDCLLEDIEVRAMKIGLVPTIEAAEIIAQRCKYLQGIPMIYDPVFAPSGGAPFVDAEHARAIVQVLAGANCELLTPNIKEAQILSEISIVDKESLYKAAQQITARYGAHSVLIKGGHFASVDTENSLDYWWHESQMHTFSLSRIENVEVRGTGCLLASAIAAQRAQDIPLPQAIESAKHWLRAQMISAAAIGKGRRVAL